MAGGKLLTQTKLILPRPPAASRRAHLQPG